MIPLAYVSVPPVCTAAIKQSPEDFCVDEILGFDPDGEGDHVLLHIQKRNLNTQDIVDTLCRFADVKNVDVGYSGLKDRHAVTSQWFSVNLTGKIEPDWLLLDGSSMSCSSADSSSIENQSIRFLTVSRHKRKLKRGTHQANRFKLLLRNLEGDLDDIRQRLQRVQTSGVPNYFGEQRFGRNFSNITQAEKMMRGVIKVKSRHKRSLYLSAIRSMLFNSVLSHRVTQENWDKAIAGELLVLDGTHSYFQYEEGDDSINERIECGDVHPSGPLWGKLKKEQKKFDYNAPFFELENSIMSGYKHWCEGLERAGLIYDRRSLRLPVSELAWGFVENDNLQLQFTLPAGGYATTVLRELCQYNQM
ncbi:MAG: tRNA pseudouridine(13) synthase TruD [Gammaproteobacteria bacterium]|nr:tRNA pseudouridine(13) synthase TruD [Gammaproteobacteria bacterium]